MTTAALNQYLELEDIAEESEADWEEENRESLEIQMYGTTEAALEKAKPSYQDEAGEAASWLSDAQEILLTNPEQARQFINRAKYFLGQIPRVYPPIG